ncbi:hypothetical protein diail_9937 [Diaporthe ilicicola]|nr:hypothetical protein diail_9937 [Diaporthe ilicicola]
MAGGRMVSALKTNSEIGLVKPASNQIVAEYVASVSISIASRRGLHLMGTARMGTDSRLNNTQEQAVEDADTRVYGPDNLFVVDASILPGIVTANPIGTILSVAEKAAERILSLSTSAKAKRGALYEVWLHCGSARQVTAVVGMYDRPFLARNSQA